MVANFSHSVQIFIIFSFLLQISFQIDFVCNPQETCENCLNINFNCAWCIDKDFLSKTRCMYETDLLKSGCKTQYIVKNNPEFTVIENDDLQDFQVNGSYAQLKPQKLKIKLVKSRPERFKMTYRPAENNPLDLYFLMDLTWSMKDDKQTIVNIGGQLITELQNLTKYFRLGFGSFADKPTMPMILPSTKSNPCAIIHDQCEPTYSFHHHLPLTNNIKEFINKVSSGKITGNLDNLEGSFDALMQVIVCKEQINWNENARKIVLLVTDGLIHFAGDGLLAGITEKNDKKCHLKKLGTNDYWEYTESLKYDYPSLEEIYRELIKRKINVIFAVTKDVIKTYKQMWNLMKDVSEVETLKNDSSNILDLIRKGYESFVKRAQFKDNSPSYISITYETDCGGIHPIKTKNYCDRVQIGKEINFYINITLLDFPNDDQYKHIIKIEESGISEFLEIEVEIQKPCPCEETDLISSSSEEIRKNLCNNHGRFSCGMCKCDEGWLGMDCSCDSQNYTSILALEKQCRKLLSTEDDDYERLGAICSNQGECECGKCHCYQRYTGKYCECHDCDDCNDPERAECICGECICKNGWTGDRCDCTTKIDSCIAPNGEICMKHGKCKCGICECDETYFGKFCEINLSHESKLCTYYEPCVKCLIEEQLNIKKCNNLNEICSDGNGIRFEYEFVTETIDSSNGCLIRLQDENGNKCDHHYKYDSDINGISNIQINIDKCEKLALFYGIIIFLITVIIGFIIMLIFRTIFYIKDKREYAKFEEQIKHQSFNKQSPIYISPVKHYEVPKMNDDDDDNPFK